MKLPHLYLTVAAVALLGLTSCQDEDDVQKTGSINVEYVLVQDGMEIQLKEMLTNDSLNAMRLEKLRFYLSNIRLVGYGTLTDVEVIDYASERTAFTYKDIDAGSYNSFVIGIGLDAAKNASDPLTFDTKHPLSPYWGLYWSWATKYRFMIMEGKGNESGTINGSNDVLISMHPGGDELYEEVEIFGNITVPENGTAKMVIELDVDAFFDGPGGFIDLRTEHQTHMVPGDREIGVKLMHNFAHSMSVR